MPASGPFLIFGRPGAHNLPTRRDAILHETPGTEPVNRFDSYIIREITKPLGAVLAILVGL
ncbi:MAG: hypothetical protein ACREUU_16315, partial [Gammaproteobacteria bacterium]